MGPDPGSASAGRWYVLARYWAFQTPGIVLFGIAAWWVRGWLGWPEWTAFAAIASWIVVDMVMYPFVKASYGPHGRGGAADLVGATGTASEILNPEGYVRVAHELWRAELLPGHDPIPAGERVLVRSLHGLTLVVVRNNEQDEGGRG